MEMNNKVIATNKTNPILMKIARREKWVKPFAKKLTAEDAAQVKELHFAKLFMLIAPATGDEELMLDSGNGQYCVPIELRCDDMSIFNSDVIVDGDGNQYRFADNLEHKQAYTFEIWNGLGFLWLYVALKHRVRCTNRECFENKTLKIII